MEPLNLTCANCGEAWTVIKAEGTISCPSCKTVVDANKSAEPSVPAPTEPVPFTAKPKLSESRPIATPTTARPLAPLTKPVYSEIDDADDPGLRAPYVHRPDLPRRKGMHPVLKVVLILMILFVLVPLAIIVLFFIVCAAMFTM